MIAAINRRPRNWQIAGLFLLLPLIGCGRIDAIGDTAGASEFEKSGDYHHGAFRGNYPIRAVCTTGMVADLVKQVGGNRIAVTQLMGEGVDPHLYKASPGDMSALGHADIIFYSGLHLEGKMADLFVRMARRKPTFAVTEGIDEAQVLETNEGAHDPHTWFDVSLWKQCLDVVRDALAKFDPKYAVEYERRAAAYAKELEGLHEEARQRLATVPADRRVLVTAHDAFRYFGRAYDVEVRGIQGISTDSEAGVKEINSLVDLLVNRKIKAVFIETSVSDRNIKALVEGCQARGHEVKIGGELFSDAMGKPGTPDGTYPGMVRHNVETIVKALE
ncbi:MAG: zinc ABC transporter substrate-binding protein [Pirellulales bacterium]|nr:zinc ABC transporter substrate-binding protein [Pirellulales bacterium]